MKTKTLIFKRNLTKFEDKKAITFDTNFELPFKSHDNTNTWYFTKKEPAYIPFIIGFCGKLYIGYKFTWREKSREKIIDVDKEMILYDKNYK
jgi:hypothetical protein